MWVGIGHFVGIYTGLHRSPPPKGHRPATRLPKVIEPRLSSPPYSVQTRLLRGAVPTPASKVWQPGRPDKDGLNVKHGATPCSSQNRQLFSRDQKFLDFGPARVLVVVRASRSPGIEH